MSRTVFAWRHARRVMQDGGIIAYPTESVYGLGCDPGNDNALAMLLEMKRRDWRKGLILVAASLDQLRPWLLPVSRELEKQISSRWPGPVTWVLPAAEHVSPLLRGEHDTLAVRVSDHPVVQGLCLAFKGAIVSTSANISHQSPARCSEQVRFIFGNQVQQVVPGRLGGLDRPTEIRDAISGQVLRS